MNNIETFKETMRLGMIQNFKNDGFLVPLMFFYINGKANVMEIPGQLFNSPSGKEILSNLIKGICIQHKALAAGIIMEAYGAKVDEDSEIAPELISGEIKISELECKQDIIVMLFSTPAGDELISYCVDVDNKSVGEDFSEGAEGMRGMFSNFFAWNKN